MALYSVVANQQINHLDIDQIVNLLTGAMNDQQVTLKGDNTRAAAGILVLDAVNTGQGSTMRLKSAGTEKWQLGRDTDDSFYVWDTAGGAAVMRVPSNGGPPTFPTIKATGAASLSNAASGRYVGNWTTLGAPAGLTASVGDWGFDKNGNMWMCTVAGTPGTWRPRGHHLIDDQTLGSSATSITSVTIPAGYDWLRIRFSARSAGVGAATATIQFNGDTTAVYSWQNLQGSGTGASASDQGAGNVTSAAFAVFPGSGAPANLFNACVVDIVDTSSTTRYKTYVSVSGDREANTGAGSSRVNVMTGTWTPSSIVAITSVTVLYSGSFAAGSRFILEGGGGI